MNEQNRMITTNMKKFARKKCWKMFLKAIFNFAFEKTFSEFPYKIFLIALHDTIDLPKFSFFLQIIIQNYDV